MHCNDLRHRWLAAGLLRRRLVERYRGSALGLAWALLLPLGMLAVYTVFFRHLLGLRWSADPAAGDLAVALRIFVGLAFVGFAGEVLTGAPRLVLEHPAYVKKMRFPLPILAYVHVGASAAQTGLGLAVAAIMAAIFGGGLPRTAPLALVYAAPIIVWALAATWLLAALGAYLRDVQHLMSPLVTVLLFLSPVFYTITTLPSPWRALMLLNPLTLPIEGVRACLLGGEAPAWSLWIAHTLAALCAAVASRWLFDRVQPGFADVL